MWLIQAMPGGKKEYVIYYLGSQWNCYNFPLELLGFPTFWYNHSNNIYCNWAVSGITFQTKLLTKLNILLGYKFLTINLNFRANQCISCHVIYNGK